MAGIATLLFGAVVGFSYNPIGDIQELKIESRVTNAKLDEIIKRIGD